MHFTRPRELLVAGIIGFGVVFLLFEAAYGAIPRLPTPAGLTLLVLAAIEAVLAFVVRSRIRSGRVVTGLGIARAVMLSKASSLLGALMFGGWIGAVAYVAPRAGEITAAAGDVPATVVGACCAAVLIGAALWLEYCCRAPKRRDHDDEPKSTD